MPVVLGVQHYFQSYCIHTEFTHGFFSGSAHSLCPHFCVDFFLQGGGGRGGSSTVGIICKQFSATPQASAGLSGHSQLLSSSSSTFTAWVSSINTFYTIMIVVFSCSSHMRKRELHT